MIDIKKIKELSPILNISAISRETGIKELTLLAKIRRGTELNVKEAQSIELCLNKYGIKIIDKD
ncbi:MAG: hypothetical protein GXX85_14150 [Ignavibacteria bacterium]|jgi:hypothetical protein|nr:hypothetical protein [Ignavibacteria bacterium]